MGRRIRDYVKYTFKELEYYVESKGSCVKKVNNVIHLNLPPYGMSKLKDTVFNIIAKKKIGVYDPKLNGIVLDVRNIKIIGDVGAIRLDNPAIHININADTYYFQPSVGSVVQGVVSHVSARQVGVIIYRVFNVSIRLKKDKIDSSIEVNSEIEFRIIKFDLENCMPYIEGELVAKEVNHEYNNKPNVTKHKFISSGDDSSDSESESEEVIHKNHNSQKSSDESDSDKSDSSEENKNVFNSSSTKIPTAKIKNEILSSNDSSDSESESEKVIHKNHNSQKNSDVSDSDKSDSSEENKNEFNSSSTKIPTTNIKKEILSENAPVDSAFEEKNTKNNPINLRNKVISNIKDEENDSDSSNSSTQSLRENQSNLSLNGKNSKHVSFADESHKKKSPKKVDTQLKEKLNPKETEESSSDSEDENMANQNLSSTVNSNSNLAPKIENELTSILKVHSKTNSKTPKDNVKKRLSFSTDIDLNNSILLNESNINKIENQLKKESDLEVDDVDNNNKSNKSNNDKPKVLLNESNKTSKLKKRSSGSSLKDISQQSANETLTNGEIINTDSKKSETKSKKQRKSKKPKDVNSQMLDILSKVKLEKTIESSNEQSATTTDTEGSKQLQTKNRKKKIEKKKSMEFDQTLMNILSKVKTEKNNEVTDSEIKTPTKRKSTEKVSSSRKNKKLNKNNFEDTINKILSKVKTEKFSSSE